MTRQVTADFNDFLRFLREFSFAGLLDERKYVATLSLAHRQFLALLSLAAELRHPEGRVNADFVRDYSERASAYLAEVISDCSECVMGAAVGCSRSSAGTLRSAIESFAKTFSLVGKPEILTCTSVPEVFELAASSAFFKNAGARVAFTDLKGTYSALNLFVHTVAPANMFATPAVGSYPKYDVSSALMVKHFVHVSRLMLFSFASSRKDLFDRMDHRNREIVLAALTREQRKGIMQSDSSVVVPP